MKDAILAAIQQEHPDAHWVGNEKPHMIESTAQAKYNDVRRVERNYTKGVHKARKEAHNGNRNYEFDAEKVKLQLKRKEAK